MKRNLTISRISALFILILVLFSSCLNNNESTGTVIIKLPGSNSARSAIELPYELPIEYINNLKYDITCIGPGKPVNIPGTGGSTIRLSLAAGEWTITIIVFNTKNIEIDRQSETITIEAGSTATVPFVISIDKPIYFKAWSNPQSTESKRGISTIDALKIRKFNESIIIEPFTLYEVKISGYSNKELHDLSGYIGLFTPNGHRHVSAWMGNFTIPQGVFNDFTFYIYTDSLAGVNSIDELFVDLTIVDNNLPQEIKDNDIVAALFDFDMSIIKFTNPPGWSNGVINNPVPLNRSTPNTDTRRLDVSADGTVTAIFSETGGGYAFSFMFPSNWASYRTVEITYNAVQTSASHGKLTIKKGYTEWVDISYGEYGQYVNVAVGNNQTYSFPTDAFTGMRIPGVTFQVNNSSQNDLPMSFTFKVTRIRLLN